MIKFIHMMLCIISIAALCIVCIACAKNDKNRSPDIHSEKLEKATFAGGCFWCMESPFEKLEGVKEVTTGYIGGQKKNPTYEDVSAGGSGHVEAVQVLYDSSKITYEELLDVYWRQIDSDRFRWSICRSWITIQKVQSAGH